MSLSQSDKLVGMAHQREKPNPCSFQQLYGTLQLYNEQLRMALKKDLPAKSESMAHIDWPWSWWVYCSVLLQVVGKYVSHTSSHDHTISFKF